MPDLDVDNVSEGREERAERCLIKRRRKHIHTYRVPSPDRPRTQASQPGATRSRSAVSHSHRYGNRGSGFATVRILSTGFLEPLVIRTETFDLECQAQRGYSHCSAVVEFAEKPDAATAARYIAAGYLWNSGNFMLRASFARDEFARRAPAVAKAVEIAVKGIVVTSGFSRLQSAHFEAIPAISFDYAVMERTDRAVVVEADFDWCDIGNWETLKNITGSYWDQVHRALMHSKSPTSVPRKCSFNEL